MIPCKPILQKLILVFLLIFCFSGIKSFAQDGKSLFMGKCASCHHPINDGVGPHLKGVLNDEFYGGDIKKIAHWAYNVNSLVGSDKHYADLKQRFNSVMTQFDPSTLSEKDLTAIFSYVEAYGSETTKNKDNETAPESNQNAVIFGVISLILAIIALILMQVNSNLKKMSDDAEGIHRPEPVPFFRNKVYIAMVAVIFFIVGGYYVTKGAIGLQRQKNMEPKQPIFYSHKVHAGINQISCLYCHGNAWESKSAAIPSVNVCMNCHKNIQEYTKGPKLYDAEGNEVDGTAQIRKLYEYAGFDPKNANAWDASKARPIEWNRVHNLPDHVYFNHSQHIRAGKVQCQTCHGEITAMNEVKQFSELSMGWCINCHRQTKVDFNYDDKSGNKFYSIYEKFHNDFKAGKMDSVTVKDIGGLECQKCHY
ncbi:MAG TPA: c-type cytochrome [Chitinophagaceae bacterium]|nr:c-type cytochrome [Chitinophagaceae bacterium]